jgi:hypothetical protein
MREVWDTQADIREQPGEGKNLKHQKYFPTQFLAFPFR